MKKTINLGLVCLIASLLACEKPLGPLPCQSCATPPSPITIYTMHPSAGNIGDEVVLVVDNLPKHVVYERWSYQGIPEDENAPWITAKVGDKLATVLLVADQAVTIKIPDLLNPGDYQVILYVGSHAVSASGKFKVYSPTT